MTGYIKELHTAIFTGQTKCGKTHLVLDLIEKEYSKHFDYIIIMCPTLRYNTTYHSKEWMKKDCNIWLIEPPKYITRQTPQHKSEKVSRLYYWIGNLSKMLACSEVLFIIDYNIADKGLDKRRQSLLELGALSMVAYTVLLYRTKEPKKTGHGHICMVSKGTG